jgi:hypothetical protein
VPPRAGIGLEGFSSGGINTIPILAGRDEAIRAGIAEHFVQFKPLNSFAIRTQLCP